MCLSTVGRPSSSLGIRLRSFASTSKKRISVRFTFVVRHASVTPHRIQWPKRGAVKPMHDSLIRSDLDPTIHSILIMPIHYRTHASCHTLSVEFISCPCEDSCAAMHCIGREGKKKVDGEGTRRGNHPRTASSGQGTVAWTG